MDFIRTPLSVFALVGSCFLAGCETEAGAEPGKPNPESAANTKTAERAASPESSPTAKANEAGNDATADDEATLSDAAISDAQAELLELAYGAASAIKLEPHVKTRSRMQQRVVETALDLDQPQRAQAYTEGIVNWRRGAALADLAYHAAERGARAEAERLLDEAIAVTRETDDWRRERLHMHIARAFTIMGEDDRARTFEAGLGNAETGKVDAVRARMLDDEAFDRHLSSLYALAATEDMDLTRNALEACVVLFDTFYNDEGRRSKVEDQVKLSWGGAPIIMRIEILADLAKVAAKHEDGPTALALATEAKALVDSYRWTNEQFVPMLADVAIARAMAGDAAGSEQLADNVLQLFETEKQTILSTRRTDALLPVAEAYHAMGNREKALEVYGMALEEGASNPNLRPRAEDVCLVCLSMALHAVEPDDTLRARIHEVCQGLDTQ
jgi:tetratricopeptide (TPR) repeat protein